jgi:hypothetical protein
MVFKPIMGARLEIAKNKWKISLDIADDDTYDTVINKLKQEYQRKYGVSPGWPIQSDQ